MRIAVAGGTGTVGSRVVEVARERGHEVVVIARSAGVDVITGTGLAAALTGVDAVVDTSNIATLNERAAEQFFTTGTANLLDAEVDARVGHHVLLSILGVDRAPYGYYAAKLAQERAVEGGEVPHTILRATQFHEFVPQMLKQLSFAGLHLAPRMPMQPVAAREVGERLVELAEAGPAGRVADLAGPGEEALPDLMRRYTAAMGVRGPVLTVTLPGKQLAAMRKGAVLPGPDAQLGSQTFEEWLAALPAT